MSEYYFRKPFIARRAQQALAADGAIACFSTKSFSLRLNADRAPQLKRGVSLLRMSVISAEYEIEKGPHQENSFDKLSCLL
jgi:hypothetical protein